MIPTRTLIRVLIYLLTKTKSPDLPVCYASQEGLSDMPTHQNSKGSGFQLQCSVNSTQNYTRYSITKPMAIQVLLITQIASANQKAYWVLGHRLSKQTRRLSKWGYKQGSLYSVCVYIYICMYVYVYVYAYVHVDVYIYIYTHITYIYIHTYIYTEV